MNKVLALISKLLRVYDMHIESTIITISLNNALPAHSVFPLICYTRGIWQAAHEMDVAIFRRSLCGMIQILRLT